MVRVLLVDENHLFTRSLQILLEDEGGHVVRVAHSMSDALAELERDHTLRLVVSDLALPDGSGLELAARIRRRWSHIAVILLTAHPEPLSRIEAARTGVSHYLTKPVHPESLLSIIADDPY
jgi:CheY-like chemotaxis protein